MTRPDHSGGYAADKEITSSDLADMANVPSRRDKVRAAQLAKLDAAFRGRTFDIVREVHLPEGQVFQTQFGNKGRHGYVLRDRATGETLVVGATVLRQIHELYLGVNLPKGFLQKSRLSKP